MRNFARLRRKQIDERLRPYSGLPVSGPQGGWLKSVRTALGMSLEQLGKRIGRTRQAVEQLERSESNGSITLAKLRSVAAAMGCDVIIGLRPRSGSLENAVRQQALRKARGLQASVFHTMELEAQSEGVEMKPDEAGDVQWWITDNAKRLWD